MNSVLLADGSSAALVTFLAYTVAVMGLAYLSSHLRKGKKFLSEYFLGSRGLGVWAFALTFAATSASGGTFTGFPSKIYTYGWVLGLWIGSYIVVPICAMGLLGKRINQVARISGSITVPDVIRDRFRSPRFGLLAVSLIVFFMSFNLIGQFKAGSVILRMLLNDVGAFNSATVWLADSGLLQSMPFLRGVHPEYFLCLLLFGTAVIIYTTYGGFHAVVWTDVMQGLVMVVGVLIMLPLALYQVGGLESATKKMTQMKPPLIGHAKVTAPDSAPLSPPEWARDPSDGSLYRLVKQHKDDQGEVTGRIALLKVVTPGDIEQVERTQTIRTDLQFDFRWKNAAGEEVLSLDAYAHGADKEGVYVTGPGPDVRNAAGFLPLSLAVSFFFMWAISGAGQPSSMVRLMAFRDSRTLRRAIFTVSIYYTLIYFPLVIIFCCARVLLPGMDMESDTIMPAMAINLTENIHVGWLAGILVAAPFAAVMSTVDSFLLMISSAVVRDIYQRNINPEASERQVKFLSYAVTLGVGVAAMIGAVNPPQFLQDIIVYTTSGLAACFLGPVVFALYWPKTSKYGGMGGMLAGFAAHLSMYVVGTFINNDFYTPYRPWDIDPLVIGLVASFVAVPICTLLGPPAEEELVQKYFGKPKKGAAV